MKKSRKNIGNEKNGVGVALQNETCKVRMCMMFSPCNTYMHNCFYKTYDTISRGVWSHAQTLRYNIKGSVATCSMVLNLAIQYKRECHQATLRAMPTPFFFLGFLSSFFVAIPKDIIPRLRGDVLYLSLKLRAPKVWTVSAVNSRVKHTTGH